MPMLGLGIDLVIAAQIACLTRGNFMSSNIFK